MQKYGKKEYNSYPACGFVYFIVVFLLCSIIFILTFAV